MILDAFRDAAVEAGIAKIEDFNRGDNEGSSRFGVNQRRGVRWNTVKAFLRPAEGRRNLTVVTGALVKRVRLGRGDDGRPEAQGIELLLGNEEVFAGARRETILAGGSIGSAQILQLSGMVRRISCAGTASRWRWSCRWARTCRTICSSAWPSR